MKNFNFVFFGTPKTASDTLEILKSHGFLPSLIVTAPDKPQGRKMILTPPPVKIWAIENNIPILQPEKLTEDLRLKIQDLRIELAIVVAYGKIFPKWLINAPKYGTLNIHYSLLPKYRGAAPVQYAILNGENETGVTIQKMVKELDAGPIVAQEKVEIGPNEKTPELLSRLVPIGARLLSNVLSQLPATSYQLPLLNQDDSKASFAPKIKKEDGFISEDDLRKSASDPRLSAICYNKFRAFYDWPRVYFMKDGKRIIITRAALENGKFVIKKVIPDGGKEINYQ